MDYEINTSEADFSEWDESLINRTKEIRNVYEVIQSVNNLYNCVVIPGIRTDATTGTYKLVFTVKSIVNVVPIKLSDYEVRTSLNTNVVNRVICVSGDLSQTIYLFKDNTISKTYDSSKVLMPPRIETIEDDTDLATAIKKGYEKLADSMYKDRVKIDLHSKNGVRLKDLDFTYFADISEYNPADTNSVKRLPVYAISLDSKGNETIEFGRLSTYWFLDS